jgi:uncharacterized protein DUF3617
MYFRNMLRYAIAFAVAMPLSAMAESFTLKPGAWEVTRTITSTGITLPDAVLANMSPAQRATIEKRMLARSGKPQTHTNRSCVKRANLDLDKLTQSLTEADKQGRCTTKIITRSSSKYAFERTCQAPYAVTLKVSWESASAESLVGSSDLQMKDAEGKVHIDIKSHWVGASCAGINDGDKHLR